MRGGKASNKKEEDHEDAEAKLWWGRGGIVLLRWQQSTKKGKEGHGRTFPEGGGRDNGPLL